MSGAQPPPDQIEPYIEPARVYRRKRGPMLRSEKDHITKVGRFKFQKHLVLANMCVRHDARFMSAPKIRSQIAFQAALAATGYERQHLKLSKDCGEVRADAQRALDELFAKAVEAAKVGV